MPVYRSVIWNTGTGFLLLTLRKDGSEWKKATERATKVEEIKSL